MELHICMKCFAHLGALIDFLENIIEYKGYNDC